MGNEELLKRIEILVAENENLKIRNIELTKKVGEFKNWMSIREGELIPKLEKRYGTVSCMASYIINPISQIVRELLDIKKLAEVNEDNYEKAKELAVGLVDVVCKYDWSHLKETQKVWERQKNWK